MKPALCLAYVAICTSALSPHITQAQSHVTFYGTIDTSLEVTNPGNGWVPRIDSGAYRGSRMGIHGAEDLGDGNQLEFTLENGFNSGNGALSTAGTLFNRQAWLGLSTIYGEFRLGRQYSPLYIPFKGQLDAFGAGTIASGLNNLSKITPYTNNAFTYSSPVIGGFSTTLMGALRDSSEGNGLDGYYVTTKYAHGGLTLLYARQQTNGDAGLTANFVGVSYCYREIVIFLSGFNGRSSGLHNEGISVSLRYDVSPNMRASVGYASVHDLSGQDADAHQWSAAFEYDLSKRVLGYISVAALSNSNQSTFTLRGVNVTGLAPEYPGASVRGVQIGMIQRF